MSESEAENVLPDTLIAQRYKVVRRLGVGGMGQVYLVQHVHTEERLALKVLHDAVIKDTNALERFRREARTPAKIDSDHVVRVTDADVAPELNGAPFLIMEYLRGEDLDQKLERGGAMLPRDVVTHLRQAARALDKAHSIGIVHRDLKPENIFVTQREDGTAHVKILDFGIAKFTSAAGDIVKTATNPGQIFGTPLYMSPEQAKGETLSICPQTDVWALGLIAHKMLTGKDFWTAETLTSLIAQIVYEPLKPPSQLGADLGPAYDAWLMKCCAKSPGERFATAGAAVFELARSLHLADADAFIPEPASSLRPIEPFSETTGKQPRPLSKTDLQLAQTESISEGKVERGSFFKVAAIALVTGAALAVAYVGLRSKDVPVPASPVVSGVETAAPTVATAAEPPLAPTVTVADTPSAQPSAVPLASSSPSAPASAAPAIGVKRPNPAHPPVVKSAAPTVSTAAAVATAKPTGDPLGSRR